MKEKEGWAGWFTMILGDPDMFDIFDLGGAPANEDCAQIGHTTDFHRLNRLEVDAYRAAIQARYGLPPDGCALVAIKNDHDFGSYRTLGLKVWTVARNDPAVIAYAEQVEDGLSSWIEAGFTAPVRYDDAEGRTDGRNTLSDVVVGALMTTRPNPDGSFAILEFAILHANLTAAYPDCAAEAHARLEGAFA